MNIALWIVQILLALAFFAAGGMKLTAPIADLAANGMTFVEHMPELVVRFIGLSEITGALGLVLPSVLRVQPKLTPIAASLLALVMLLALGTHLMLGEFANMAPPVMLGLLSSFVAWGRFSKAPITPRGS